jgi:hypothetical protein
MLQLTIADIMQNDLSHLRMSLAERCVYLVRNDETVLYIGRSSNPVTRLRSHLVGQLAIEYPLATAAREAASRRRRARSRRRRRLPFQTKGVGCLFQPATVCSNQSMTSWAFLGWCPASARRTMMRWMDSAMFKHEPPRGV